MPKNKRPNRKPGGRNTGKRTTTETAQGGRTENSGGVPNVKGGKSVAKTYGPPKSSRSPISPAMHRGSARNR